MDLPTAVDDVIVAAVRDKNPLILFLGQRTFEPQNDDVLKAVLQRLGRTSDLGKGWPAVLGGENVPDDFYEWLSECWARLPRSRQLQLVAKIPWSAVFTSSLDPGIKRDFEWTNRTPHVVLTSSEVPLAARSTGRTPIYHLFGRAGTSDSLAAPPRGRAEFRNRLNVHAIAMLNRIPETATALGLVVVDGYDPSNDWLPLDPLLSVIEQLPISRVLWFGWQEQFLDNPELRHAHETGRLIGIETRLGTLIAELDARGRLDDVSPHLERGLGSVSFEGGRLLAPSAELRIRIEATATIVDDSWAEFLAPLGSDALYAAFREFHGDLTGPKALATGIRYGFAITRDFEADLMRKVTAAIDDHSRFVEPFLIHGQSGTGKTIALSRLAVAVRKAQRAAVLYAGGRIPNSTDVEDFCEAAEQAGAVATLLICDGNAAIPRYRDLLTGLRSRGRRVVLVGTTYRQVDTTSPLPNNYVEAPDLLSDIERKQLADLLSRFGDAIDISQIGTDKNVLATLYRVLPVSRYRLAAGLSNEARATEAELRQRGARTRPVAPVTQLAEQLIAAGLKARDESILSERLADALASANDSAGRLIDLVMVAGRLNCSVPVNLLMRALSTGQASFDLSSIASVFRGLDLFRWHQSEEGEELFISPRLTLEAELICRRRLGGAAAEAEQLAKLVKAARLTWDPAGSERRFLLDLLQRFGPDGPARNRYRESYLTMARVVTGLRRSLGIHDPSLLLQEAVLRRIAIREEAVEDGERLVVLDEAREAVQAGLDQLANQTGRGARHARANLAVERAAIFGFLATYRAQRHAPQEEVWSSYLAARTAARSAVSASGTYHPLDIGLWVPADLISSGVVSPSQKLELLADLQSVLDQIDPASLPREQLENFNRRRFKLGEQLEQPELTDEAYMALEAEGSTAGYYLKAKSLGPSLLDADSPDVYSPQDRSRAAAAAGFLGKHWSRIEDDPRCIRYLLHCTWAAATGQDPLRGERGPVPSEESQRRELLQIARALTSALGTERDNRVSYLEALLAWLNDEEQIAARLWRELARDTDFIDSKRVVRRHLITDSTGAARLFSGRIEAETEPGRFALRVDELGRRVQVLARDFPTATLQYGRTVPSFAIAFNYIGPIADPAPRRSALP